MCFSTKRLLHLVASADNIHQWAISPAKTLMRRDNGDVTCFVGASTLKSNLAEGVRNFIHKRISDSWDSFEDFTTAMN
jgi:hypothetical protein